MVCTDVEQVNVADCESSAQYSSAVFSSGTTLLENTMLRLKLTCGWHYEMSVCGDTCPWNDVHNCARYNISRATSM